MELLINERYNEYKSCGFMPYTMGQNITNQIITKNAIEQIGQKQGSKGPTRIWSYPL